MPHFFLFVRRVVTCCKIVLVDKAEQSERTAQNHIVQNSILFAGFVRDTRGSFSVVTCYIGTDAVIRKADHWNSFGNPGILTQIQNHLDDYHPKQLVPPSKEVFEI